MHPSENITIRSTGKSVPLPALGNSGVAKTSNKADGDEVAAGVSKVAIGAKIVFWSIATTLAGVTEEELELDDEELLVVELVEVEEETGSIT